MIINPGRYNQRITFLSPPSQQNSYGELAGDWPEFKTVWASKSPIIGNEYFNSFAMESRVEVKFNMRFMPGITNEMRIKHGSDLYEILSSIDVKNAHIELLCYCKRVV